MKRDAPLHRDQSGSAVIEFALAVPVLFLFIIGIIQLGLLFSAYAGMGNAVNEAARYATISPTPTDDEIVARLNQRKFMLQAATTTVAAPVRGTVGDVSYIDLSMTYQAPLNFIFFSTPPITLQQTRRAYLAS